jgi:hypothetical protein
MIYHCKHCLNLIPQATVDQIISDAAASAGRRGGSANTPAQRRARAKSKGGGRPKNSKNKPKKENQK